MKVIKLITLTIVIAGLMISCAGGPLEENDPSTETGITNAADEQAEPKVLWQVSSETIRYPDGRIDKVLEYQYDDFGRRLLISERDSQGKMVFERRYEWSGDLLLRMTYSDAYGLLSVTEYSRDSQNRIVEEIKNDADGKLLSKISYTYDGGRLVQTVASDGSGIPQLVSVYTYSEMGLIEVDYQLPSGRSEAIFQRLYDGDKVVEEKTVLPDGTVETSKSLEYSGNELSMETYFSESAMTKKVRYEYDPEGKRTLASWENRGGVVYEIVETDWTRFEIAE